MQDVVEYAVFDEHSHELIANVKVGGRSGRDPLFTSKISGPRDTLTRVVCRDASTTQKPVSRVLSVTPAQSRKPAPKKGRKCMSQSLSSQASRAPIGKGYAPIGKAYRNKNEF